MLSHSNALCVESGSADATARPRGDVDADSPLHRSGANIEHPRAKRRVVVLIHQVVAIAAKDAIVASHVAVGDGIGTSAVEADVDERIVPSAAVKHVASRPTVEVVVSDTPDKNIVTTVSEHRISVGASDEPVVASTTFEVMIAGPATDGESRKRLACVDNVVAVIAIGAKVAIVLGNSDAVVAGVAIDVEACPEVQHVGSGQGDAVVAIIAADL